MTSAASAQLRCLKATSLWGLAASALLSCAGSAPSTTSAPHLAHGVFVGTLGQEEDVVPERQLSAYVSAAGKALAYVYLTNNWYVSRQFPAEQVGRVQARGAVPMVRLMLRSEDEDAAGPDPLYTLQAIVSGAFDQDLKAWGKQASQVSGPLYAEYGTEMNGSWFTWNAKWNGKAAGAALFVQAYRHIAAQVRLGGGSNVRWIFHPAAADDPGTAWNKLENYYPGGDIISLVGVSAYGAQSPEDQRTDILSLRQQLDSVLPRLKALAPDKPVFLLEFGSARNPFVAPEVWAEAALRDLTSGRWPQLRGFSWWNSAWENDNDPAHNSELRVELQPALAAVFRRYLSSPEISSEFDAAP